jgi:hypothetical protein
MLVSRSSVRVPAGRTGFGEVGGLFGRWFLVTVGDPETAALRQRMIAKGKM